MANPSKLQFQIVARKEMTMNKGGVSQVHVFEKCRKSAKNYVVRIKLLEKTIFLLRVVIKNDYICLVESIKRVFDFR